MATAKVTSKGQITIPKPVREALGVRTGDRVVFQVREDGVVEMRPRTGDLLSLAGMLVAENAGVTVEDMDTAIAEAVTAEFEDSVR